MDAEAALVSGSRRGDHAAFTRLVAPHQTVALRVAYAIAGADAEDVVQDALVKAYTRLGQFDAERAGAGGFRSWLLAIVANEARNRRRSAGRRAALHLRVANRATVGVGDPAAAIADADERQRLLVAVAALPERDREVVALRYLAELSEAETAAALGCPAGTVKSRLHRALARLRSELETEVVG